MRSRTVVLRDERTEDDSRSLTARIAKNGDLEIEGQDLGSGVEEFWGRGLTEYEWWITVRAADVPRVVAALGGKKGDDVLELLGKRFSEDEDCASKEFFDEQGIAAEFSNRVGD